MSCTVSGMRQYSSDLPQGGLDNFSSGLFILVLVPRTRIGTRTKKIFC